MLREHLKTLGRQAVVYGSADVLRPAINFLILPIITRHLTLEEFGVLGILLLFGVTTKILFRMGLDSGFFRIYYDQASEDERRTFITTVFVAAAVTSSSGFALSVLAAGAIGRFLVGDAESYIVLVALDTFLTAFAFVPMNLFRIQGRSGYFTGASLLRNALNAILKVALVVAGWGVSGILWANALSSAVFVAVLTPTLVSRLGTKVSWRMLREVFAFGFPKVPHSIAYQILNLSDRKLIDWLSTRAEAGLYHVAYQFGTGVKFFLSAFELAWGPFVYSLLKRGDAAETMARIATYAAAVLFGIGLALAVLGRELLELMTAPAYHSGYPVIPVIVLAHVFQGLFLLSSIGIGISKKSYYYPIMTFSAAALNVTMNLLLIPGLGKMGAAWATAAGYGLMTAMGAYFSNKSYPIPFEWGRMGRLAAATLACYGICLAAPEPLAGRLMVKLGGLALWPLALYVLGFFRPEEIGHIKGLLGSRATASPLREPGPR